MDLDLKLNITQQPGHCGSLGGEADEGHVCAAGREEDGGLRRRHEHASEGTPFT